MKRKCRDNHAHDRHSPRHSQMLEQPDQRGEDEAQKNSQRDRHENLATKIQRCDDDAGQDRSCHCTEESHQFFSGARFEWLLDHDLVLSGYWSMAHEG